MQSINVRSSMTGESIEGMVLSISLQLSHRRLAGRGLEQRPNHSAGGSQADSQNPGRKRDMPSFSASPLSHLQLNYIRRYFILYSKRPRIQLIPVHSLSFVR